MELLHSEDEIYDKYAKYQVERNNDNYGSGEVNGEVYGGAVFSPDQKFEGTLKYKLRFCYSDASYTLEAQTDVLYAKRGLDDSRYRDDAYR